MDSFVFSQGCMSARRYSTYASSAVMWCRQWKISLTCTRGPQRASSFGLVTDLLWCSVFTGEGSAVCLMEKVFEGRHELPFSYPCAGGWGLQKGSENLQQASRHTAKNFLAFFTVWLNLKAEYVASHHIKTHFPLLFTHCSLFICNIFEIWA